MVFPGLPIACPKRDRPNIEKESVIKVVTSEPKSTQVGKGILVQPNGDSVIGFEFEGLGNAYNLQVWFGEQCFQVWRLLLVKLDRLRSRLNYLLKQSLSLFI